MKFKNHGRDNGKHYVELLEDDPKTGEEKLTGITLEVSDKDLAALENDEAFITPHATKVHKTTHKIAYNDPAAGGESGPVTVAEDGTVTKNEVASDILATEPLEKPV